jgi:hypothetical protein
MYRELFAFFARVLFRIGFYAVILRATLDAVPDAIAGFYAGHDIGQGRHAPSTARFFTHKLFHDCAPGKSPKPLMRTGPSAAMPA